MTEAAYKERLEEIRRQMFRSTAIDVNTACAYTDWMLGQLAEMEKEKAAVAGRLGLRKRLGILVELILTQTCVRGKGYISRN